MESEGEAPAKPDAAHGSAGASPSLLDIPLTAQDSIRSGLRTVVRLVAVLAQRPVHHTLHGSVHGLGAAQVAFSFRRQTTRIQMAGAGLAVLGVAIGGQAESFLRTLMGFLLRHRTTPLPTESAQEVVNQRVYVLSAGCGRGIEQILRSFSSVPAGFLPRACLIGLSDFDPSRLVPIVPNVGWIRRR